MHGTLLIFFMREQRTRHGLMMHEWLLRKAQELGLQGGTAVKAMAGFGRHGLMHADHFFELGGDLPVEVTFMTTDEEATTLLACLETEGESLFYVRLPAMCGVIGDAGQR